MTGPSIVLSDTAIFDLVSGLWFAVDEIVHHDNVVLAIIIRTRGRVRFDADLSDARVLKHDAKEGEAAIAWRRRDRAAEKQPAIVVKVLDHGAMITLELFALVTAIRLIDICEDRAETRNRSCSCSIGTGHEEQCISCVAPHWSKQP